MAAMALMSAQSEAATSQLQTVEIYQREQLTLIEEGEAVAGGFHGDFMEIS